MCCNEKAILLLSSTRRILELVLNLFSYRSKFRGTTYGHGPLFKKEEEEEEEEEEDEEKRPYFGTEVFYPARGIRLILYEYE